jgi:hypothetical protein
MKKMSCLLVLFLSYLLNCCGNKEDIEDMFLLAKHGYSQVSKNMTAEMATIIFSEPINNLHLVRVPKAGSTSLSVIARRMVGCNPPGPCCKFPGDPPGSCPHRELFTCQLQFKVIGCTGHQIEYRTLLDKKIHSISILREPRARALSAYFYPGHHHNSECKKGLIPCLEEYMVDSRFRNVATKMFSGEYAYSPVRTCKTANDCKFSLETAMVAVTKHFSFVGIAEMWELSLVVLHRKFPWFAPEKSEFSLTEGTADSERIASPLAATLGHDLGRNTSTAVNVRINQDATYLDFKNMAVQQYGKDLQQQSALDIALYQAALQRLCQELYVLHLWRLKRVQRYWRSRVSSQYAVEQCR